MKHILSQSPFFKTIIVFLMFLFTLNPSWGQTVSNVFRETTFYGITWGNGLFVAVGDNGLIVTSPDGFSWTAVENSTFDNLRISNVVFGNGMFVAVGDNGKISFSPDGFNWTAVTNSTFGNSRINDIAYGNGLFVAVGNDNKIVLSSNGIVWRPESNSPFNINDGIYDIVFGNDKFVISSGRRLAVSSDAINWTLSGTDYQYGFPYVYDMIFGNGLFLLVGNTAADSGFLFTSNDGLMWIKQESSFHTQAGDIITAVWGNGRFIAVGGLNYGRGVSLAISDGNAEDWFLLVSNSNRPSDVNLSTGTINSIIFSNGLFVGVGGNGKIATSTDGINWTDLGTAISDILYFDFPYYYRESEGEISIIRYYGTEEHIIIPEEINRRPVVSIGESAYHWRLVSVVIPSSVKNIGQSAFNSYFLTSVTLGNNLALGYRAFGYVGFDEFYIASNRQAGKYTRPNTPVDRNGYPSSTEWTRE